MDRTETFEGMNGGNDNQPNQFPQRPNGQLRPTGQSQQRPSGQSNQNNSRQNYAVKCGKHWWSGNTWGTNPAKLSLQDAEKILQNTLAYSGKQAEILLMPDSKHKQSPMTGLDLKLTFFFAGSILLLLVFAGVQP